MRGKRMDYLTKDHEEQYNREKNSLFNKQPWNNQTSTCRKKKKKSTQRPYVLHNSKWIIKCKTMTFLEDNIEDNLGDLGCSDDFLDTTPKIVFHISDEDQRS